MCSSVYMRVGANILWSGCALLHQTQILPASFDAQLTIIGKQPTKSANNFSSYYVPFLNYYAICWNVVLEWFYNGQQIKVMRYWMCFCIRVGVVRMWGVYMWSAYVLTKAHSHSHADVIKSLTTQQDVRLIYRCLQKTSSDFYWMNFSFNRSFWMIRAFQSKLCIGSKGLTIRATNH